MDLRLLLASLNDADSGQAAYLKEGIALSQVQGAPRPGVLDPKKLPRGRLDYLGSPNDFVRQRWAVIVPEQGGDELFARIAPLVALREAEQQAPTIGDAPGRPFKVPPRMSFEQTGQWMQEKLNPLRDLQRPRFLLILGTPDQVSIELQQALSVYYYVGRLAFADLAGYSEYAAKVVEFARPESLRASARVLSYTVRSASGQDAPDDGYDKLMVPIVEGARAQSDQYPIPFQDVSPQPGQGSAQQFLQLARDPAPTVLMSLSHGLGRSKLRPWSEEELRRFQGLMHFGGKRDPLRAEDVAQGDFLPGGAWFYFACFGAGTPARSSYRHWLQSISPNLDVLKALPENGSAFIAALPQAALANRRGPLAVMGHLDLAWSYSYDQKLTRRGGQVQRFMRLGQLAQRADERQRIGPVFQSLLGDLGQVHSELANYYDGDAYAALNNLARPADPKGRASLWMLRQDLNAYILLGDPAASLPVAPRPASTPAGLGPLFDFVPRPAASPTADASRVTLDQLVDAVLACLAEKKSIEAAATQLGVTANELRCWVDSYKSAGREALSHQLVK